MELILEYPNRRLTDDSDLVERSRAGDSRAFEELYRGNVGRVYSVCLRMVADKDRAEELTQQAFIRAWEMLGSFRGESRFSVWLHRIAVNVVLVDLRSARRRTARIESTDEVGEFGNTQEGSPAAGIDLEKAIELLPPQARTVFVLHDVEGYKHEEIAAMMGLATGTTKAQLHRARKILKEELER